MKHICISIVVLLALCGGLFADSYWQPTQPPKSYVRNRLSIYSVKDYGAKGDSATDDRAAIQSAIHACADAGGGTVWFPLGTYRIGTNAGADSNLYIKPGSENIKIIGYGSRLVTNISLFGGGLIGVLGDSLTLCKNILIEGLTIHDYSAGKMSGNNAIWAVWADGVIVKNCRIERASHKGIVTHWVKNVWFDNNIVDSAWFAGIVIEPGSWHVATSQIGSRRAWVTNNYVGWVDTDYPGGDDDSLMTFSPTLSVGCGISLTAGSISLWDSLVGVIVANNYVGHVANAEIHTYGIASGLIYGNMIDTLTQSFDVGGLGQLRLHSTEVDDSRDSISIIMKHYDWDEEDITIIRGWGTDGNSKLLIGGGAEEYNSVEHIEFYTGDGDHVSLVGTMRLKIDSVEAKIIGNARVVGWGYFSQAGNDTNFIEIFHDGDDAYLNTDKGNLKFQVGGVAKFFIDSATGKVQIATYKFPTTDGTADQVLTTDGSGVLAWNTQAGAGGGEANTIQDTGVYDETEGFGLSGGKAGVDLHVKGLIEGSNITITKSGDSALIITGPAPGSGFWAFRDSTTIVYVNDSTGDTIVFIQDTTGFQGLRVSGIIADTLTINNWIEVPSLYGDEVGSYKIRMFDTVAFKRRPYYAGVTMVCDADSVFITMEHIKKLISDSVAGGTLTYWTESDDNDTSVFTATGPNTTVGINDDLTMQNNDILGVTLVRSGTYGAKISPGHAYLGNSNDSVYFVGHVYTVIGQNTDPYRVASWARVDTIAHDTAEVLRGEMHTRSHAMTSGSDHTATAWRAFYSAAGGAMTELALGANGTYLKSNGASSAPTWATPGGAGLTYWTEGDDNDTSLFTATGPNTWVGLNDNLTMQGNQIAGVLSLAVEGGVTLDDGVGASPALTLQDADNKYVSLLKYDVGHATLYNNEGHLQFQFAGDNNDYIYFDTFALNVPMISTGGGCDLVITSNSGYVSLDTAAFIVNDDTIRDFTGTNLSVTNGVLNASGGAGGWTDDGNYVRLTTSTDSVGIGTTSPEEILHLFGNSATLKFEDDSENKATINVGNSQLCIASDPDNLVESSDICFDIDGAEVMRIHQSTNVGIGTLSPDERLDVVGNIAVSGTVDTVDVGALGAKVHNEDLRHFIFALADPNALYDIDSIFCIKPVTEKAITVTRIDVTCNADPTTEPAMALRFADNFISRTTPTTIDVITTTAGVTTITSGFDDATIPASYCVYFVFTADPEAALKSITVDITWTID